MTQQQKINEELYKGVEKKAKLGNYGELNIMLNLAKELNETVDDIYKMSVNAVYTLVGRGKRMDYLQAKIRQLNETQSK